MPLARRLDRLPAVSLPHPLAAVDARLASTPLARLLGLAGLSAEATGATALLLPRTCSIHTFGMRFALHLVWLDRAGEIVGIDRAVPPRRMRCCRGASAVLELPAG